MPNLQTIKKWYTKDRDARARQDWKEQYETTNEIRKNEWELPEGFRKTEGHFFDYNPYHKIADYNTGQLFGNPIHVNMVPRGREDSKAATIAEQAVNWARDLVEAQDTEQTVFEDVWWFGYAAINVYWDASIYDSRMPAGRPRYEAIKPTELILDSTIHNIEDMKRIHRIRDLTEEDVKMEYGLDPDADLPLTDPDSGEPVDPDDKVESETIRVIETQYKQMERVQVMVVDPDMEPWSSVLPGEAPEAETSNTIYDLLVAEGYIDKDQQLIILRDALIEFMASLGIDLKAYEDQIQEKIVERVVRMDWIQGWDEPLLGPKPIQFARGQPGDFTYQVIIFRPRSDSTYSYGAPFYSRELFYMFIWWQQLVMTNAQEEAKIRAVHAEDIGEDKARAIMQGGQSVGIDTETIRDIGGLDNAFQTFKHQGLQPAFFELYEQLNYTFHDVHNAHKEMMGQPVGKRAPAAMQELVQQSGRVPQVPHQNRFTSGLKRANYKLFTLLQFLTPGTQIRIQGEQKRQFLDVAEPVQAEQIEETILNNPEQYERYIVEDDEGNPAVDFNALPPANMNQVLTLNRIDGDFDVEIHFDTDTLSVKRLRSADMLSWYQAGLLDPETAIRSNPDIANPGEVLERLMQMQQMMAQQQAGQQQGQEQQESENANV